MNYQYKYMYNKINLISFMFCFYLVLLCILQHTLLMSSNTSSSALLPEGLCGGSLLSVK